MVLWISCHLPASVKGLSAGITGTDSRYTNASPVGLVLTLFLNILFSPHMKPLFLTSLLLSLHFQILKDDHFCSLFPSIGCDGTRHLPDQLHIQSLCVSPTAPALSGPMLPLKSADSAQHPVQPVFFTGEVEESSPQDSSVRPRW